MIWTYLRYFWFRKNYDYGAGHPPGRGGESDERGPGRPKKSDVPGVARGGGDGDSTIWMRHYGNEKFAE